MAHEVAVLVYRGTAALPKREWFGLGALIRKSAVSVPSNLAEGAGKLGPRELCKYADIAIGSYNELEYQLRLAVELGLIGAEEHGALDRSAGANDALPASALSVRTPEPLAISATRPLAA